MSAGNKKSIFSSTEDFKLNEKKRKRTKREKNKTSEKGNHLTDRTDGTWTQRSQSEYRSSAARGRRRRTWRGESSEGGQSDKREKGGVKAGFTLLPSDSTPGLVNLLMLHRFQEGMEGKRAVGRGESGGK